MTQSLMTTELVAFVVAQQDRQAIHDCLLRYTRGVDRHDKALMQSAYHLDAFDEHGVAEGSPETFCDWAIGWHAEAQTKHQHIIVNHSIELDGNIAHGETYYIFWGENRQGPATLSFGRYIDRFEKREGKWAIAHRVCVNEIVGQFTEAELSSEAKAAIFATGPSRRDKGDISYTRPLIRKPA